MSHEMILPHPDIRHKSDRGNWLRASILGVNDGVVSTASLMLGISAAAASETTILTAGIAGLFAGAFSMAAGEYVSVSSKRDSERADIIIERNSIAKNPELELKELTAIYEKRGLEPELAKKVAEELHRHDALEAHTRDELGIADVMRTNPLQAAFASSISFALGAIVPIVATLIFYAKDNGGLAIVVASLILLAISGALGAYLGGGNRARAAARVLLGGALAMGVTAWIGHIIGTIV